MSGTTVTGDLDGCGEQLLFQFAGSVKVKHVPFATKVGTSVARAGVGFYDVFAGDGGDVDAVDEVEFVCRNPQLIPTIQTSLPLKRHTPNSPSHTLLAPLPPPPILLIHNRILIRPILSIIPQIPSTHRMRRLTPSIPK